MPNPKRTVLQTGVHLAMTHSGYIRNGPNGACRASPPIRSFDISGEVGHNKPKPRPDAKSRPPVRTSARETFPAGAPPPPIRAGDRARRRIRHTC
ncbi:hypothetical protein GCM10023405_25350 [Streptomonospora salina]